MSPRSYTLRSRASGVETRREAVLSALLELYMELPIDQVTLPAVAERSGVSLKTILRQFGSRSGLVTAATEWTARRETARRAVAPGDIDGAVRVLTERYEELGTVTLRRIAAEDGHADIREAGDRARRAHLAWLAEVFGAWLPPEGDPVRRRRLAALFTATEIFSWWELRHLGFSVQEARDALSDTLTALVQSWSPRSPA